jgi:DNA modification methylase
MARKSFTPTKVTARSNPRLAVKYLPLNDLVQAPLQPRKHSPQQIRALADSAAVLGFNVPLLIDRDSRIVAGHARWLAARQMGLEEVPTIQLEHLTPEKAMAFMLADNKFAELSVWDEQAVAAILKQLSELTIDFNVELTGFSTAEIDIHLQSLAPPEEVDGDEVEVATGVPVSRLGDLWLLNRHRLICGSALVQESYRALLEADRASAVFADPPYNLPIHNHVTGNGRKRHREFAMASGEMSFEQFREFLVVFLELMGPFCLESVVAFVCMDWRHVEELSYAIRASGNELLNICVWVKGSAGLGSLYRSQHELVFVVGRPGAQRRNNIQLGRFGRTRTNVWHHAGMNSFARKGQLRGLDMHPTVKPLLLVQDAILDVTARGEIVLDPFCGSGTTIIAAERSGRRGYGIEIDPIYVDAAILRWQKATGETALHQNGRTFDQLREERGGADVAS